MDAHECQRGVGPAGQSAGLYSDALPANDVSPELLAQVLVDKDYPVCWYQEVIEPLTVPGRHDPVRIIKKQLSHFSRLRARRNARDWQSVVNRPDHKSTGGRIRQLYRGFRAIGRSQAYS
ncbi:hypothetical protein ANRL3_00485 [Anaerolineae bacterium]|nr:hypothetical protein ANRL3_00485 [Anaerolineae bacterium]